MKTQTNLLLKTFCCGRIRPKGFYPNSDEEYGEDGRTRLMKERGSEGSVKGRRSQQRS